MRRTRCQHCHRSFGLVRKYLSLQWWKPQLQFCSARCRADYLQMMEERVKRKRWHTFLSGLP